MFASASQQQRRGAGQPPTAAGSKRVPLEPVRHRRGCSAPKPAERPRTKPNYPAPIRRESAATPSSTPHRSGAHPLRPLTGREHRYTSGAGPREHESPPSDGPRGPHRSPSDDGHRRRGGPPQTRRGGGGGGGGVRGAPLPFLHAEPAPRPHRPGAARRREAVPIRLGRDASRGCSGREPSQVGAAQSAVCGARTRRFSARRPGARHRGGTEWHVRPRWVSGRCCSPVSPTRLRPTHAHAPERRGPSRSQRTEPPRALDREPRPSTTLPSPPKPRR